MNDDVINWAREPKAIRWTTAEEPKDQRRHRGQYITWSVGRIGSVDITLESDGRLTNVHEPRQWTLTCKDCGWTTRNRFVTGSLEQAQGSAVVLVLQQLGEHVRSLTAALVNRAETHNG